MKPIYLRIAEELGVREQQVAAAISSLDGGATVTLVARYRKEATGVLDDTQLRTLEERLRYLRELDERRAASSLIRSLLFWGVSPTISISGGVRQRRRSPLLSAPWRVESAGLIRGILKSRG